MAWPASVIRALGHVAAKLRSSYFAIWLFLTSMPRVRAGGFLIVYTDYLCVCVRLNSCVKRHVWLNIHARADLLRLVPAIRTDAFARLLASLCASACLDISDCHWTLACLFHPPQESQVSKSRFGHFLVFCCGLGVLHCQSLYVI